MLLKVSPILLCLALASALTDEEINAFKARTHIEQNTGLQGTVSVKVDQRDPKVLVLSSNGIPDHETGTFPSPGDPNNVEPQNNRWRVPRNPRFAASTTCLPMGPIAMATNGVAMYNPFTITCCDAGQVEAEIFDSCKGHPSPDGRYHYHTNPSCNYNITCDEPSSIVGVAFDGFPIYGPNDENGQQLSRHDLDECNGRTDKYGNYRYHIINEYPYFMGCYKGTVRLDSGVNVGQCQCTEPVYPCEEFGKPPMNLWLWGSERRRFACQIPKAVVDDDGNGATSVTSCAGLLIMTAIAYLGGYHM